MTERHRNKVSAVALILLSIAYIAHALLNYNLGAPNRMGAGYFPVMLGGALLIISVILLVLPDRNEKMPDGALVIPLPVPLFVLAGMALFALSIERLGIVPAIFLLVIVSSLADRNFSLVRSLLVAAFMSAFIYLIFGVVLGLQLEAVRMPF